MKRTMILLSVVIGAIALSATIVRAAGGSFDWLQVGAQGIGGVTWFNGTIINNTTEGGVDNPVTFGDNVRIDGRVWRGATAGTGDSQPFIVNDNMEVTGDLTVNSFTGTGIVGSDNIADGTVATDDLADDSVTPAKINGTGGANLPIAYGYCNSDGSTRSGTSNISCSWNAGAGQYEITITGESYYYTNYIAFATPISSGLIPSVGSVNNKFVVDFVKHDGTTDQQTAFNFIIYKP